MDMENIRHAQEVDGRFWRLLVHGALGGIPIGAIVGALLMAGAMMGGHLSVNPGELMPGILGGALAGIFLGAFLRVAIGGGLAD